MPHKLRKRTAMMPLKILAYRTAGDSDRLGVDLVSAVRTAVRLLEPLFDAVLAENVLAIRQA